MGMKFGKEEGTEGGGEGTFGHWCNVSPLRGEKPQNRPVSKLNTGRLALRAMLPVKTSELGDRHFIIRSLYKNLY